MADEKDKPQSPQESGDNRTPYERFEQFSKRIFSVPKHEVDELREKEKREGSRGSRDQKRT